MSFQMAQLYWPPCQFMEHWDLSTLADQPGSQEEKKKIRNLSENENAFLGGNKMEWLQATESLYDLDPSTSKTWGCSQWSTPDFL